MWDSSCVLAKHSNKDKTLPSSAGFCVNLHRLLRNPGQKDNFYKTFSYRIFFIDETEALTSYATWQFTPKAQFSLPQLAESHQDPKNHKAMVHGVSQEHLTYRALRSKNGWSEMGMGERLGQRLPMLQFSETNFQGSRQGFSERVTCALSSTSSISSYPPHGPSQGLEGCFPHKYPNNELYWGAHWLSSSACVSGVKCWVRWQA